MKFDYFNDNKKEVIYSTDNSKEIAKRLLNDLFGVAIKKFKFKVISCNYDKDGNEFSSVVILYDFDNIKGYYYDIPTDWGHINTQRIEKMIKGE